MNRLHQKCFAASACLHGLLALVVLVAPAWIAPDRPVEDLPLLEVIPFKLVDDASFGGGTPKATLPPPAPTPAITQPETEPIPQPKPAPARVEPRPEPAQPKPITPAPAPKEVLPDPPKEPARKPIVTKPVVKVTTNLVRRNTREAEQARLRIQREAAAAVAAAAARRAAQERAERIQGSLQNLSRNLSSGTEVGIPGPGGEAYANYGQALKSIYFQAWNPPADINDDNASVETQVVVARDGTVLRGITSIVKRSGHAALDKSVQQALDRVLQVPELPDTTKESQRTFRIFFNLKAKRSLG
jgi:outer membrane biosynthesis protein TonB